jgi:hypothetical protein
LRLLALLLRQQHQQQMWLLLTSHCCSKKVESETAAIGDDLKLASQDVDVWQWIRSTVLFSGLNTRLVGEVEEKTLRKRDGECHSTLNVVISVGYRATDVAFWLFRLES